MTTTTLGTAVTQTIISYGSQYGTTNMVWSQRLKLLPYSTCITSSIVQAIVATIFTSLTAPYFVLQILFDDNTDDAIDNTKHLIYVHNLNTTCDTSQTITRNNNNSRASDNNGLFGCVTKTTPLHIIDHGSVVYLYLILLQIRFYDQQDSLSLLENSNNNNNGAINNYDFVAVVDEVTTSVTVTTHGNDDDTSDTSFQSSFNQQYDTPWSFTAGANDEATTVVLLTAASYVSPFTTVSVADEVAFSVTMTTVVYPSS